MSVTQLTTPQDTESTLRYHDDSVTASQAATEIYPQTPNQSIKIRSISASARGSYQINFRSNNETILIIDVGNGAGVFYNFGEYPYIYALDGGDFDYTITEIVDGRCSILIVYEVIDT